MTISTTAVDVTYSPDGSTTEFALPFAFADADHVKVELDGELLVSGYSIAGAGDEDGGTLTFEDAPAAGTGTLYAYRETPLVQEVAPVNNSTVFASVLGRGLDLGVLRDQELAAATARVADALDAAVEEAGSEIGLIGKVDKDADIADLVDLTLTAEGDDATPRPLFEVLNDWTNSIVGYGGAGDGITDNTEAFERAMLAHLGKRIFLPPAAGPYMTGNVGSIGLAVAGAGIEGLSGYQTVIKAAPGLVANSALFRNINAGTSGSAYLRFADLRIDLNSQNIIGIDLSHCDTCVVERVNGQGGTSLGSATGRLIKFGAPTDSSSYNNVARDCAGSYFAKAIEFGVNANQNRVEGGSYILNAIAIDCAPGGVLAHPVLWDVRIESNGIGVKEGAQGGVYMGYFEDHSTGDFSFTADSDSCVILPGSTTAATATPLHNATNATNLRCLSDDFGYFDIQDSMSRVRYERGRNMRRGSGKTTTMPVPPPGYTFTDCHGDPFFLANASGNTAAAGVYAMNGAGTDAVLVLTVDSSNRINIPGYDYAAGVYRRVLISDNWNFNPATAGLEFAGVKVLGAQQAAIVGPTGGATVDTEARAVINLVLTALRNHGQIAT